VIAFLTPVNKNGADEATRKSILLESLRTAREELVKLQGPDPHQWSWGKLHVVRFRHPLDRVPNADALLDVGPVPRPGDGTTVNATSYTTDSFEQVSGASYREIFDLSDWDKSMAVNTPGQSGQPGSPHYADLLPLWDQGDYFPLTYSKAAVQSATSSILVLEP
jgi:penicillin amidase